MSTSPSLMAMNISWNGVNTISCFDESPRTAAAIAEHCKLIYHSIGSDTAKAQKSAQHDRQMSLQLNLTILTLQREHTMSMLNPKPCLSSSGSPRQITCPRL